MYFLIYARSKMQKNTYVYIIYYTLILQVSQVLPLHLKAIVGTQKDI